MTDLTEVIAAASGAGGVVGAATTVAVQWIRSRSSSRRADTNANAQVEVAHTIADERIAPKLLDRIDKLETRCEERDLQIDKLQAHVQQCEEDNQLNAQRADQCEERYRQLERRVSRVERRTTPPEFPAVPTEDT